MSHTWLSLEQMLCLHGCHLRDSGKDVRTVTGSPLHAVAVVDAPVSSLLVQAELPSDRSKRGGDKDSLEDETCQFSLYLFQSGAKLVQSAIDRTNERERNK